MSRGRIILAAVAMSAAVAITIPLYMVSLLQLLLVCEGTWVLGVTSWERTIMTT